MNGRGLGGWLLAGGLFAAAIGGSQSGCFKTDDDFVNYTSVTVTGAGGGSGGGDVGGGGPDTAKEFFEEKVKGPMVTACGGACHGLPPYGFLQIGSEYAAITTYKTSLGVGLLTADPDKSMLMTYPPNPAHTGKSWKGLEDLRALVLAWLTLESENIEPITVLQVGPVEPNGLTVLPLDPLGGDLAGVKMIFYAEAQGDPPELLVLSDIEVWPPNGHGVRVTDPTFVVVKTDTSEVLDTSFHGDPYVLVAPNQVQVGPGELILTTWGPGFKLAVRFEALQGLFADDEGVTYDPCTRVDLFADGVDELPIQAAANAPNGLLYCAEQCHGGTSGPLPTTLMPLAELLGDEPDYDFACAKVRQHITPTNVDQSEIIAITHPSSSGHPFRFGGNTSAHNAFKQAMKPWIDAEGAAE
jgi:hypothetical protein